jgi:hypothetical protein
MPMSILDNSLCNHSCTLRQRVQKRKLPFSTGLTAFVVGETVTGMTSGATATVDAVKVTAGSWNGTAVGYLVLSVIVGTFTVDETLLSSSGSAVAASADIPYITDTKEVVYYWQDIGTYACRFSPLNYNANPENRLHTYKGEVDPYPVVVYLPPEAAAVDRFTTRIYTEQAGYAGEYGVVDVKARSDDNGALDHFEVLIQRLITNG